MYTQHHIILCTRTWGHYILSLYIIKKAAQTSKTIRIYIQYAHNHEDVKQPKLFLTKRRNHCEIEGGFLNAQTKRGKPHKHNCIIIIKPAVFMQQRVDYDYCYYLSKLHAHFTSCMYDEESSHHTHTLHVNMCASSLVVLHVSPCQWVHSEKSFHFILQKSLLF